MEAPGKHQVGREIQLQVELWTFTILLGEGNGLGTVEVSCGGHPASSEGVGKVSQGCLR